MELKDFIKRDDSRMQLKTILNRIQKLDSAGFCHAASSSSVSQLGV